MTLEDNVLRVLQIVGVTITIIVGIITGIKYIHRKVLRDVSEHIRPEMDELKKEQGEVHEEISLIKQMLGFFEKYFLEPSRHKKD